MNFFTKSTFIKFNKLINKPAIFELHNNDISANLITTGTLFIYNVAIK